MAEQVRLFERPEKNSAETHREKYRDEATEKLQNFFIRSNARLLEQIEFYCPEGKDKTIALTLLKSSCFHTVKALARPPIEFSEENIFPL